MNAKKLAIGAAVLVTLASSLLTVRVEAQTVGGTISGTIRDQSGAVVPGAKVSIKNTTTAITREVMSNAEGFFQAPNLLPGDYEVTISAAGFNTEIQKNVSLTIGAEQVVNIEMRVGNISQAVEVAGRAPTVELASSTIGGVVESRTISQLPLNGRDWTQLATLEPGVATVRAQHIDDPNKVQRGNGLQLTISGGRPSENNYRLNGITINDYANTGPGSTLRINLGVDAIQEFSVLSDTFPAQYGRSSGGIVNAIMRSGTNQLHGTAYEFFRNDALDSANFFDNANRNKKPPFHRNQFGGSFGGPIRKDRTFFFGDYEGLREHLGLTTTSVTLSQQARIGQIHDRNGNPMTVTVDQAIQKALAIYPSPTGQILAPGDTAIFSFVGARISHENFATGRIDHRFSDKDSLNGSYMFDDAGFSNPDEYNNKDLSQASRRHGITLEETHIFGPQLLTIARGGFSRTYAAAALSQIIFNPALQDQSLGYLPGQFVGFIRVSGLTNFGGGLNAPEPELFHYNSFQGYDDIFLTKGIHALKFGVALERDQDNYDAPVTPAGQWTFGTIANFLTNNPTQFTAMLPGSDTNRGMRQTIVGAYIQDDVRYRRNLTLNIGLRWEMSTVPSEVHNRLAGLANLTDAQPTVGQIFDNPTFRNFEPRIGFAWDPFGNGKTAVRSGFGIYDDLPLTYIFVNRLNRTPPFFATGFANPPNTGKFPNGGLQFLLPGTFRTVFYQHQPNRAYKMEWNLNIQRELLPNLTLTAGYVGSRGVHLPRAVEDMDTVQPISTSGGVIMFPPRSTSQRINSNFGRIAGDLWDGNSFYDALEVGLRKRLGHGLQAQAAYTWGKSIDDSSVTFSDNEFIQTIGDPLPFNPGFNRGLSDFHVSQNFVLNFLWDLPTPSSWSGPQHWLLGGWQVGAIYQASTGVPFTALINSDQAGTKSSQAGQQQLGERPNLVASADCRNPVNPGNSNQYIKVQCFTFPADLTLGNLGRNTLIGPGLSNFDFSLYKNNHFRAFSENLNAQFRVEVFNILNHANFALPPVTSFSMFNSAGGINGDAGRLTTTQTTQREIQFALKFTF